MLARGILEIIKTREFIEHQLTNDALPLIQLSVVNMDLKQRLAKINTLEDVESQLSLAKDYIKRLRRDAVKAGTLADKLAFNEKIKAAEATLRRLRSMSFDIDDAINAGKTALSLLGEGA